MAGDTGYDKLRFPYAGWAVLETMLFGGLANGWGALVFVLKEDGIYGNLCPGLPATSNGTRSVTIDVEEEEEDVICSEQDAMLNLWFTIAAALRNIFGIVIGLHVYKFGTRSARLTGWVVFGIGALMMAFADDTLPWLILPALLTLSYGGVTLLLTNVQVSGLFPTAAGVVVTLVSGAFDFSATTQLMVKILSESGVSRLYSYIGIAVLHGVLVLVSTLLFLPKVVPASNDESSQDDDVPDAEHNNRRRHSLYNWREKRSSTVSGHRHPSHDEGGHAASESRTKADDERRDVRGQHIPDFTMTWLNHSTNIHDTGDGTDSRARINDNKHRNKCDKCTGRLGCNHSYCLPSNLPQTGRGSAADDSAPKTHLYVKKDRRYQAEQTTHAEPHAIFKRDTIRDGRRRYISIIDVKQGPPPATEEDNPDCGRMRRFETEPVSRSNDLKMNGHVDVDEKQETVDSGTESDGKESVDVMFPTLRSCLTSTVFMLHVLWMSLNVLRMVAFFGLLNSKLTTMFQGDREEVSFFTNIQAYCMLTIMLICWISGAVYDWQTAIFKKRTNEFQRRVLPGALPLALTSALGVVISILNMIENTVALYIMFVVFVFYNAFIFGVCLSFLLRVFPERYFGILNGVLSIIQGTFCFLQYGIFRWHDAYTHGPLHANIFMLTLVTASFLHPAYLAVKGLC